MRIKKVSKTTQTGAQIIDGYSNSQVSGYSCNYINKMDRYSTSETKTNKVWVDGKPVYRKVIIDTTSRDAGNYNVNLGITNLGDITDLKVLSWQNNTTCFVGSTSPLDAANRFSFYYNNNAISFRNSWESIKIIIVIEYTKTTDTSVI